MEEGQTEKAGEEPGLWSLLLLLGAAHGVLTLVLAGFSWRLLGVTAAVLASVGAAAWGSRWFRGWFRTTRLSRWALCHPAFWFCSLSDFLVHTPLYHRRMEFYRRWIPFARHHFFSRTRRYRPLAFAALLGGAASRYYPRGVVRLPACGPPPCWQGETPQEGLLPLDLPRHPFRALADGAALEGEVTAFAAAWRRKEYAQARPILVRLTNRLLQPAVAGAVRYQWRLILFCFLRDDPSYHRVLRQVWPLLRAGQGVPRAELEQAGVEEELLGQVLLLAHGVGDLRGEGGGEKYSIYMV